MGVTGTVSAFVVGTIVAMPEIIVESNSLLYKVVESGGSYHKTTNVFIKYVKPCTKSPISIYFLTQILSSNVPSYSLKSEIEDDKIQSSRVSKCMV